MAGLAPHEVMTWLQRHGVPAGLVRDTRDPVENDAGCRERHIRLLNHPETEPMTTHGETIGISDVEPRVQRAPLLREHTEYVLKDLLGMEEADVDQLYVDSVPR